MTVRSTNTAVADLDGGAAPPGGGGGRIAEVVGMDGK